MAISIIQGGYGLPFLAPPVFEYLVSGKCTGVSVVASDVPEENNLQFVLNKVRSTPWAMRLQAGREVSIGLPQIILYTVDSH